VNADFILDSASGQLNQTIRYFQGGTKMQIMVSPKANGSVEIFEQK